MLFYPFTRSGSHVIVCEDILSAIRVNVATGLPSVALLGTSVDDGIVRSLVENFDRGYVFLDPDARGKSRDLARRLDTLMVDGAMSIVAEKQPKELSDAELVYLII